MCKLTLSVLQSKSDTCANSVDPVETGRNESILTETPICNSGRVHIQGWNIPLQKLRDARGLWFRLQCCTVFLFSGSQRAVKLYVAWFCPFAQNTRISLLTNGADFDIQYIDPYDKTPEFLAINPHGLVPALIHNGKCVYESAVCIEYVDEALPNDMSLLPTDQYGRAHVRIWSDFIGKGIAPLFYQMLRKPEKLQEIKMELWKNLAKFSRNISDDRPFFTAFLFI